MRATDLIRKEELSNTYKTYKNKILKLTRLSKANRFNRFLLKIRQTSVKSGKVLNLLLIQNPLKLSRVSQPYESTIKLFQTKKI